MSKIVTTRQQYGRLLELIRENPQIAQGFTSCPKEEVAAFWQNVTEELNSLGPPAKEIMAWKKVWLDWKAYIKRKLVENKREQAATGGGPHRQHSFNALEEEVIRICSLGTSTFGVVNTVSVGLPVEQPVSESDADVSMMSNLSRPRRTRTPQRGSVELLKEQIEIQRKFYEESAQTNQKNNEKMEQLSSAVSSLCLTEAKILDVEKAKLEEMRRHNRKVENMMAQKIEIKRRMLELEEKKMQKSTK